MHIFTPEIGMMGPAASWVLVSCKHAGAAIAQTARRPNRVASRFSVMVPVNNGAFHEGLNMADLEAACIISSAKTTVRHGGAFRIRRGESRCCVASASYGILACSLMATTWSRSLKPARAAIVRARAGGVALLECRTIRTRHTRKAWAIHVSYSRRT
jgi:2-oxoisovalerate dehydrogenase E1 component